MPHKRAKRSAREQQRKERGSDLAPRGAGSTALSLSTEGTPKSVARVLDAAKIRAEYRQKKRAHLDDDDDDATNLAKSKKRRRTTADAGGRKSTKTQEATTTIEIRPGESLKHFNRRVEDHMRPLVQSAMRASAATERKERRAAAAGTPRESKARTSSSVTTPSGTAAAAGDRPKEFATISSAKPRRLNDIATAPPELKKLPRGAASSSLGGAKHHGVLSMAQRAMMETERENAIRRYREMKERKAKEGSEQTPGIITLSRSTKLQNARENEEQKLFADAHIER